MAPGSYHDFDLQFERVADGYQVTARGQDGVSTHRFQLAVTPTELENLVLRIGRTRRSMRRLGPPDVAAARQFGQRLFSAVFADDVAAAFRRSLDLADQQLRPGVSARVGHAGAVSARAGRADLPDACQQPTGTSATRARW